MSVLDQLNSKLRVDASEPSASESEIKSLISFSPRDLPTGYLEVVKVATEVEILVDGSKYIRIWSPPGCIEMNEEYEIQRYLPGSLAIGDDEGGKAIVAMDGPNGEGIYLADFGDLDPGSVKFIAPSLEKLLIDGIGIDKLS